MRSSAAATRTSARAPSVPPAGAQRTPTGPGAVPRNHRTAAVSVTSPTVTSTPVLAARLAAGPASAAATTTAASRHPIRARGRPAAGRALAPRTGSGSDERVVVEVLPRGLEGDEVMAQRARKHGGEPLRRPA